MPFNESVVTNNDSISNVSFMESTEFLYIIIALTVTIIYVCLLFILYFLLRIRSDKILEKEESDLSIQQMNNVPYIKKITTPINDKDDYNYSGIKTPENEFGPGIITKIDSTLKVGSAGTTDDSFATAMDASLPTNTILTDASFDPSLLFDSNAHPTLLSPSLSNLSLFSVVYAFD